MKTVIKEPKDILQEKDKLVQEIKRPVIAEKIIAERAYKIWQEMVAYTAMIKRIGFWLNKR